MKKRKMKSVPVLLMVAATVLLLASTIGSTQAALTYYSQTYSAEVTISNIGVTLLENDKAVSYRDYIKDDQWHEATGRLLENMLPENEKFTLGKEYEERISVNNSGSIDTYVRVILTKSWVDAEGKNSTLDPGLIELNLLTGGKWILDEDATTKERTVLYYTDILPVGETTPALSDTLRIDPVVGTKLLKTEETHADDGTKTVTYVYEYDGYSFVIEAEVDAVQTHNAQAAIKSAWGVDVDLAADGSISLR